jgi:hypothetical protein
MQSGAAKIDNCYQAGLGYRQIRSSHELVSAELIEFGRAEHGNEYVQSAVIGRGETTQGGNQRMRVCHKRRTWA